MASGAESRLPSFFQRREGSSDNSGLVPITYDRDSQEFTVDSLRFTLKEFNPYKILKITLEKRGIIAPVAADFKFPEGIPNLEILNHPLLIPLSDARLVSGPKLQKWVSNNPKIVVSETPKVIKEAYEAMSGEKVDKASLSTGISLGFNTWISPDGPPKLQTIGLCACLSASLDGLRIEDRSEKGFSEYELHNIDTDEQLISLYAGLGYIAGKAASLDESCDSSSIGG